MVWYSIWYGIISSGLVMKHSHSTVFFDLVWYSVWYVYVASWEI
jgi:hypothetical protein